MKIKEPAVNTYIDLLRRALAEDVGSGDVTSEALIDEGDSSVGVIVARQEGVAAGLIVLEPLCGLVSELLKVERTVRDGDRLKADEGMARISGPKRDILTVERVALNFLGHLSGVATLTNRFVRAIEGSSAVICDTRKTMPGMRSLDKYAVRAGGGTNHRMGLYDAALIKDNHLLCMGQDAIEALAERLAEVRGKLPKGGFIELEVDELAQLRQVLDMRLGVDMVLLDNFSNEELAEAVKMRNEAGQEGELLLEASGNIGLENVGEVAKSGVDRISVGALTHSAAAFDVAMELGQK